MPNFRLRGAPTRTPAGAPAPDPLCKWGQIRSLYRYTGRLFDCRRTGPKSARAERVRGSKGSRYIAGVGGMVVTKKAHVDV